MITIEGDTIAECHEQVIDYIMTHGTVKVTEDGETVRQLEEPISIKIRHPFREPMIHPGSEYGPRFAEEYVKKILYTTPLKHDGTDPTYTYGNRFRTYPASFRFSMNTLIGKILKFFGLQKSYYSLPTDQIWDMIFRLCKNPNSRRAVAITWVPSEDSFSDEPPCLQLVQATVIESDLNLFAYFRSNDMLSAWGQNAYALSYLQNHIAHGTNCDSGWLEIVSHNAHIYFKRDATALQKIRDKRINPVIS